MSTELLFDWIGLLIYVGLIATILYKTLQERRSAGASAVAFEAMGTRTYGGLMIGVFMAATMLGPADALALSSNGLQYGLVWVVFPLGAALAQFVSSRYFVQRIRQYHQGKLTVGDIFAERCGEPARFVVGAVTVLQSVAFTGVLVLAGGQVMSAFLDIPQTYGMIATALLVGVYTSFGGMNAVSATDRLQAGFMLLLLLLCAASIVKLFVEMPFSEFSGLMIREPGFSQDHTIELMLSLFLAYFMGELLLPAYTVRALMSNSASSAMNGFLLASVILSVWYLVITFAGAAGSLIPVEIRNSADQVVLLDIVRSLAPAHSIPWYLLGAVVFAGLLALIHSTFDSFLNVGAVSMARDVVAPIAKINEERQGWLARQFTVTIAVFGLFVAIWKNDLIDILMIGYTIWVPSLLGPMIWVLLNPARRLGTGAFVSAVLAGAVGWLCFEEFIPGYVPSILGGFAMNVSVLCIAQWMGRADHD